jgi:hypothetical protein
MMGGAVQTFQSKRLPTLRVIAATALALVLMCPVLARTQVATGGTSEPPNDQAAPDLNNDQIIINYSAPTAGYLMPVYERYKRLQLLERLKQFLSPLKLPRGIRLIITAKQCDQTNSWWSGRADGLFLCYEWADWVERIASGAPAEGLKPEDVIVGGFLQVTFHELGHAMFDIYDIPILGKEEDAADQMAGIILTQFGKDVAQRTMPAAAYMWKQLYESGGTWPHSAFSDVHGHDLQRSYNYLCMAYGSDPETFKDFVDSGLLPKERADNCPREYQQLINAFKKTMMPHIDPVMMKEVQDRQWLPTEGVK